MSDNLETYRLIRQLEGEKSILERDLAIQENSLAYYEGHLRRMIDDSTASAQELARIPNESVERMLHNERHQRLELELRCAHEDVEEAKREIRYTRSEIIQINLRIREIAERFGQI